MEITVWVWDLSLMALAYFSSLFLLPSPREHTWARPWPLRAEPRLSSDLSAPSWPKHKSEPSWDHLSLPQTRSAEIIHRLMRNNKYWCYKPPSVECLLMQQHVAKQKTNKQKKTNPDITSFRKAMAKSPGIQNNFNKTLAFLWQNY